MRYFSFPQEFVCLFPQAFLCPLRYILYPCRHILCPPEFWLLLYTLHLQISPFFMNFFFFFFLQSPRIFFAYSFRPPDISMPLQVYFCPPRILRSPPAVPFTPSDFTVLPELLFFSHPPKNFFVYSLNLPDIFTPPQVYFLPSPGILEPPELTQSAVQKLTASAKLYPWLKPLW